MSTSWETPNLCTQSTTGESECYHQSITWWFSLLVLEGRFGCRYRRHIVMVQCAKQAGVYTDYPQNRSISPSQNAFVSGHKTRIDAFNPPSELNIFLKLHLSDTGSHRGVVESRNAVISRCHRPGTEADTALNDFVVVDDGFILTGTAGDPRGWITQVGSGTTWWEVSLAPAAQPATSSVTHSDLYQWKFEI